MLGGQYLRRPQRWGGFILAVGVVVFGAVLPARLADIDDRVSGCVGNSASVNLSGLGGFK